MSHKRFIGIFLIIGILLFSSIPIYIFSGLVSCSSPHEGGEQEFEVIRQAADAYMNSGKPLYITAKELYDSVMAGIAQPGFQIIWYNPLEYTNAPFIIDVRSPDAEVLPNLYPAGHIPGSLHIPWQQITKWRNMKNLPKDRQIVVVSANGQIGAEVTAILNVLGYDAVNLMWGMTSWTSNPEVAPGRYDKAKDTVFNWGGSYRAVCPISEPSGTYPFPIVENTDSEDTQAIIRAAADNYLSNGARQFILSAADLYDILYYEDTTKISPESQLFQSLFFTGTATGNPYTVPFFLDIREDENYYNGHLCGCLHVLQKDVFKKENLMKLPLDRQIMVYSDTGHESGVVAALLNLLGYDVVNLKFGITSWSLSLPGKEIAPERFEPRRDCMDYDMVTGYVSFLPCPT